MISMEIVSMRKCVESSESGHGHLFIRMNPTEGIHIGQSRMVLLSHEIADCLSDTLLGHAQQPKDEHISVK